MKDFKFWGTATVGTKGQVVIPAKAREEFKLQEGEQLLVVSPPFKHALVFIKADTLEKMLEHMQTNIDSAKDTFAKASSKKEDNHENA